MVEPGWVDEMVAIMASPYVAWILLMFGLVGLYVELHSPGVGADTFSIEVTGTR